jgi:hypothetical protein
MISAISSDIGPGMLPIEHGAESTPKEVKEFVATEATESRVGEIMEIVRDGKVWLGIHAGTPDRVVRAGIG